MEHHLTQFPLVVRREHRTHKGLIDYLLRTGELVPVLPGVHRWADAEETFELRARAALKWQVSGVLLGSTAARLTWWPELKDEKVRLAGRSHRRAEPWLVTSRAEVDDDLIVSDKDMRVASPALSIIQMCVGGDGAAISEGLRRRVVTLGELWEVFGSRTTRSQYNGVLRKVLQEARDKPWSPLELRAHHTHRELDRDNERRNALIRAGWRPLHFSSATLDGMVPAVLPVLKDARSAWKRDRLPLLPLANPDPDGWTVA